MMANQNQTQSKTEERNLDSRLTEINGKLINGAILIRDTGIEPIEAADRMKSAMNELFKVRQELGRKGKALTKIIPTRGADGSVRCITGIDPHYGAIFAAIVRDGDKKVGLLLQIEQKGDIKVKVSKNKAKELLARHAPWMR
ncbi:MAG: hypothetical protein KGH78_04235 [Candidatus Micrarchaeota archaeon]|nr:hypothetical protein [Candidatus Micrarchaeota archaeon]